MEDEKIARILDAATEIFAREGYSQATMEKISEKSKVSTSLIYIYFEGGKLEILLTIFISFWQNINSLIYDKLALMHDPYGKLVCIINTVYESLTRDKKALYLSKVLGEHIPFVLLKDTGKINEKRKRVSSEINRLLMAIDGVIAEGQRLNIFIKDINPALIRQILYGSIQMIIYGCYLKDNKLAANVGYNKNEAKSAVNVLISRLLIEDNMMELKNKKIF